jgi:hypothetical protein
MAVDEIVGARLQALKNIDCVLSYRSTLSVATHPPIRPPHPSHHPALAPGSSSSLRNLLEIMRIHTNEGLEANQLARGSWVRARNPVQAQDDDDEEEEE